MDRGREGVLGLRVDVHIKIYNEINEIKNFRVLSALFTFLVESVCLVL